MRTLCLHLKTFLEDSWLEASLVLSPQLQYRGSFIFIDIDSTAHLLGGELACLEKALEIARVMNPEVTAAIADAPPVAQMLAVWRPSTITTTGQDSQSFVGLGLEALRDLEGLEAWPQVKPLEHIIAFLQSMGIHKMEGLLSFQLVSFRERWGSFGALLWNRLHGKDLQVLSPYISSDPLVGYIHLDDPLGSAPLLLNSMAKTLDILFLRLLGLGRFAQRMEVIFHCEYSNKHQVLQIEPVSPSRDQELFRDLLAEKMSRLELENPVREIELSLFDVPEKIQQLDFFEPRDTTQDRWRRLISFAKQADCEMGFLQVEASHFPEKSFHFVTDWPEKFTSADVVEKQDEAVQVKRTYAKGLAQSPRPSLLLEIPQALTSDEVRALRFISNMPSERIESAWWQLSSSREMKNRDYYFALSKEDQLLWVFRDRVNSQYYLHGYFD